MSDRDYLKQGRTVNALKAGFLVTLLAFSCGLTGCGKKPSHVDPPIEVKEDKYPLIYPDPSTDPKPESEQ